MKIVALIFALSFSLCNIGSGHVVENYEKEIRELTVSQYSVAGRQLKQATDLISLPVKFAESFQQLHYNYLPVIRDLFIKIRILLI